MIKVVLRQDKEEGNEMEHILLYKNGLLLDDSVEGFPSLCAKDILQLLKKHGILELEVETIE